MFLTFFVILSLLGFGLFFGGFWLGRWELVLLGSVIILTSGAIVEVEGIEWYPTVDTLGYSGGTPITITQSFTTYTRATSFEVMTVGSLYIYGGFVFLLLSVVALLRHAGMDKYEEQAYAEIRQL